jgi:serine/threonine-protein kinase RsbW
MPETSWRRKFPGDPRELRVMRRWLASLLPECPARDDLALAATELASNAIRHTASGQGGQFAVEVTRSPGVVRVAVTDGGGAGEPRVIDDPLSEHGRGLRAVGGLSERMGVSGGHLGRRVWADIAWGDADAAEPASPQPAARPHRGRPGLPARPFPQGPDLVRVRHQQLVGARRADRPPGGTLRPEPGRLTQPAPGGRPAPRRTRPGATRSPARAPGPLCEHRGVGPGPDDQQALSRRTR